MVSNFVMKCHGGGGGGCVCVWKNCYVTLFYREINSWDPNPRNVIIGITIDNYHTNAMREQICVQKTSVKILGL